MADHSSHEDRLADRNLRMIGVGLRLPETPSAADRDRIKHPRMQLAVPEEPSEAKAVAAHGRKHMKRNSILGVSALAAAVAVAAIFLTPTDRSVVNAATIMTSLRESTHKGVRVTFDVNGDAIDLKGRLAVVFDEPMSFEDIVNLKENPLPLFDASALFSGGGKVPAGEAGAPIAMEYAGALGGDDSWVYVRSDPPYVREFQSFAVLWIVLDGLTEGAIFDLNLTDEQLEFIKNLVDVSPVGEDKQLISEASVALASPDDGQLADTLKSFLLGLASREDLEKLLVNLEQYCDEVTIEPGDDGVQILKAKGFASLASDESEIDALKSLVVRIAYLPSFGVLWCASEAVGKLNGVDDIRGAVRVEFIDAVTDEDVVRRADYENDGETSVVKVSTLISMFGSSAGANVQPAHNATH